VRRAWLVLALGLALPFAPAAADGPAKPNEASELAGEAWEARLTEAEQRLASARERAATSESALSRARHRRHPRGEALDALVAAAADARRERAAAEAELPELLEQARRAGVAPGVLRRFEAD
jgi:chromosome segregation ATPase